MTTYRFRQGIDYGPRSGTLGLSFHMSEGGDGLVSYLAQHPGEDLWEWADRVNGVSCNAALLSDGTIWQMLAWSHASGNLNPDDRAGEYGYYGGSHLRAVLGDGWTNPNEWTISMEIAGYRSIGPTDAQVRAAIEWAKDMKAMFPTLRGATGHHDQSPKPCPGLTPNMRAIFDGVGGHGLWSKESDVQAEITDLTPKLVNTPATWYELDGKTVQSTGHAMLTDRFSPYGVGTKRAIYVTPGGGPRRLVLVAPTAVKDVPGPDCTDQVADAKAAQHEATRAAAIAAVEKL